MQNLNPIERIAYTLIFGLLFITVIIEWKIAKFTGAWVFFFPILLVSISGWSVFSDLLFLGSAVFCIFWTIRSYRRWCEKDEREQRQVAIQEADIWNRLES